jgi:hypothetical protein
VPGVINGAKATFSAIAKDFGLSSEDVREPLLAEAI